MAAENEAADDIDGLDEFVSGSPMPMVMGITPENTPRPAFRLEPLPPREREVTLMKPQYDVADEDGKKRLIGFKPEVHKEVITGGYLVHCMKGHKVAIDSLAALKKLGLGGYVPMLKLSKDTYEGEVVGQVEAQQTLVRRKAS